MLQFLDELEQILGRSPSTEPLFCGVCTDDFYDVNESDETLPDAVPQLVSDDAIIEDHMQAGASQSDSNKSFSEGDWPSSSGCK